MINNRTEQLTHFFANRRMNFLQSTTLILGLCLTLLGNVAIAQTSTDSKLTRAREKAKSAIKKFDTLKRLNDKGSASSKALRDADLLKKLALLELSNLVTPEKAQENALLRVKFVLKYRTQELDVIRSLYQRGSASKVTYDRAVSAKEVAASQVKSVLSITETQRKIQTIKAANSKLAVAQKEFNTANELFKSGSVSQAVMEQVKSNLEIAKSELAESKKSLGAKAFTVRQ